MLRIILVWSFFYFSLAASAQVVLGDHRRNIYDIAMRDSLLVAVTDNSIELWNIKSKEQVGAIKYSGKDIFSVVSFGRDYTDIITGTRSGELAIWNMTTEEKKVIVSGNYGAITAIDVNVSKELLAVGFSNHRLVIYSLVNFNEIASNSNYAEDVTVLKFTKDNGVLLSGSADGKVTMHSLSTNQSGILQENLKRIWAIAETGDSNKLAIASGNGRVTFLKRTGSGSASKINSKRLFNGWITTLDYYSKNDCLVYATLSGRVFIETMGGEYKMKIGAIINQVKFIARSDAYISLALATKGKGLILLDAVEMKFKG